MFDNFSEEIKSAIRQVLYSELNTGIPGKITSVDNFKKRQISVKPTLVIKYQDDQEVPFPEIKGVPAILYGNSEAFFKTPLKAGDSVWLSFSQRSIDSWLSNDSDQRVVSDNKKFDISDCVAHIGLNAFKKEISNIDNNDSIEIVHKNSKLIIEVPTSTGGNTITIKADGSIELGGSNLKKLVNEEFKNVYDNHVHNYQDSVGQPPVLTPKRTSTPGSVSATTEPNPGTGGLVPPATFGSALTGSQLTQKVTAE